MGSSVRVGFRGSGIEKSPQDVPGTFCAQRSFQTAAKVGPVCLSKLGGILCSLLRDCGDTEAKFAV